MNTPTLRRFQFERVGELVARARTEPNWLWEGYLAPRSVTLLTSLWKSGKTTLISVLLARMATGGPLAGRQVRPGRAVIVSEESEDHWANRHARLKFDSNIRILSSPFRTRPTLTDWEQLIDDLLVLHGEEGLDLLVIDPLAAFLPGPTESDAKCVLDMCRLLQRLTSLGICVLILHHPKKGHSIAGQAARGSGALTGSVDIILEMDEFGRGDSDDRRRRLRGYSRHSSTPRRLVLELTADGTDYISRGDIANVELDESWPVLAGILEDANDKLTREQISKAWPSNFPKPSEPTLWRWLQRAVADGQVLQEGTGRRNDSFRFWLPGMEEVWKSDPFYRELPRLSPLEDELGLPRRKTLAEVRAAKSGVAKRSS